MRIILHILHDVGSAPTSLGGGIRSLLKAGLPISIPKDLSEPEKAWRKKQELEMMFQEVYEEKNSLFEPSASQELTLRGFLKVVFPLAKRSDLQQMMSWIKRPETESKVMKKKKLAQPDMGRPSIDLCFQEQRRARERWDASSALRIISVSNRRDL